MFSKTGKNLTDLNVPNNVCLLLFSSDALDIDVPGKIRFQESGTLSCGCELAKFKTGIHVHVYIYMYHNTRY